MNNPIEWKSVPDFPEYEVSNYGQVRNSDSNHILSPHKSKQGYLKLNLRLDGVQKHFLVHRLVMLCFVGPSDQQVNHIDGNKSNNRLENLEYCTQSENIKHAFKYDLYTRKGEQNPAAKLDWKKVDEIRLLANLKSSHYTQKKLAEMYGVGKSAISKIVQGKKWKEENRPKD